MHSWKPFETAVKAFTKLPGIGLKTAERIVFHLLIMEEVDVTSLSQSIVDLKMKTRKCSECLNISESDPCEICQDPARDKTRICVVQQMKDLIAIEKSGVFSGVYHLLHSSFMPVDNENIDEYSMQKLMKRLKSDHVKEVIFAFNPNLEGESTAHYLSNQLHFFKGTVTRLGKGLPSGGNLEFMSRSILSDAFEERRNFNNNRAGGN